MAMGERPAADATWTELASEAKLRYQTATAAAQEGRWADYGAELDALGEALMRLEQLGGDDAPSDADPSAPDDAAPAEPTDDAPPPE